MISTIVKIIDNVQEFERKNESFTDLFMGLMSSSIEIQLKTSGNMPFDKGRMKSSTRSKKVQSSHYQVQIPIEYAAAQNAGLAGGKYPIKNYTTPGTGPHFFEKAIDVVKSRRDEYIKAAQRAAGIGMGF